MIYSIDLYFDTDTEVRISKYPTSVSKESLEYNQLQWITRPHITLAIYNNLNLAHANTLLEETIHSLSPFYVTLYSLPTFLDQRNICLSPCRNSQLDHLHQLISTLFLNYDSRQFEGYSPENWTPHCTLSYPDHNANNHIFHQEGLFRAQGHKLRATCVELGISTITFPIEQIASYPLSI